MAEKKNGRARGSQPSKPSRKITEKVEHVIAQDRGMTIREEFAMAAMQGLLSNPGITEQFDAVKTISNGKTSWKVLMASMAASCADAMLAELAKEPQP